MAIRRKHYRSYGLLVLTHYQNFKTLLSVILYSRYDAIIQGGDFHNCHERHLVIFINRSVFRVGKKPAFIRKVQAVGFNRLLLAF